VKVTALLVSHNGARWLPAVLSGIEQSTRRPDRVVAVDTGSTDDSAALVADATGVQVLELPAPTPYAEAVRAALEALPHDATPDEWIWLLHDDANPDPDCLAVLARAAEDAPADVVALGPKVREWPSLRRLLEVGVTLSGTGRRETGLERGEYDQGQHDQQQDVLAVNTAGMLVRRQALAELGLDPALPVFGADLDFGWRAARAGRRVQVVPDAVLFHVEASRRGLRDSALVHRPGRQEREGALFTLLANSRGWTLPFRALRMLVGGLLRALGLLLLRAPGEAADEVTALVRVLARPDRIASARRDRRAQQHVAHDEVRHLLAPFWLPYRHGLDWLGDVWVAVVDTVRDGLERRRREAAALGGGRWSRLLRHPGSLLFLGLLALAVVVGWDWVGSGALQGGALLAAPEGVGHWWDTWSRRWHALGTGTSESAGGYALPLAIAGTVLLGKPSLLVTLVFLFAVPLAFVGALRFFRRLVQGRWTPLWAAAGYALVPVVTGAVGQGRLGSVVAALVLPWAATSALAMHRTGAEGDRAAWRTALGLGLLTAFAPTAWLLAVLLGAVSLLGRAGREHGRRLVVVLGLPLVLVLPWLVGTGSNPDAWLLEAGKAAAVPHDAGFFDLLLGRPGGPAAAPAWLGIALVVAGVAALLRSDTRATVVRAWVVAATSAVLLALVAQVEVTLPGVPVPFRAWNGFLVLVLQGALLTAAAVASSGVVALFSRASFSWRQPVAGITLVGGLLTPVLAVGWWVQQGDDGLVQRGGRDVLPTYMTQLARESETEGVLLLEGGRGSGIEYQLLRYGALRLGDDAVLAVSDPDPRLHDVVEAALTSNDASAATALADYGTHYVYAPAPVDSTISGGLDAAAGFTAASAPAEGSRAWRIEPERTLTMLDSDAATWRPLWLVLQVLGVVAGVVLALPERVMQRRWR
jgi:GT2 family glycosyltransferase